MTYRRQPENIKVCPACGTNLSLTARRCAVCGYGFTDAEMEPAKDTGSRREQPRLMTVTVNLPVLLGIILIVVAINILFVLGLRQRDETKNLVFAQQVTATYNATIYVSPTLPSTPTRTPAPPTNTPVPDIEYVVLEGDSCLSIADHFNIYLDSLLSKNEDLDCALLNVGTVLIIPQPTPTPQPTITATGAVAP